MWGSFLSNYKFFSCQSNCLLLLEVCKNHYKKENISVGGSDQHRDALFWIDLRKTWLNLFGFILADLSFSTFIFSIDIKLFIRYPAVPFVILMLIEQQGHSQNLKQVPQIFMKVFDVDDITLSFYIMTP